MWLESHGIATEVPAVVRSSGPRSSLRYVRGRRMDLRAGAEVGQEHVVQNYL